MTVEAFIVALLTMVSSTSSDQARANVDGAMAAAVKHPQLSVELLLGVAYVESRFDPRALSRIECETDDPKSCTRKTGVWPRTTKPPKARPSWYCGPLQSGGYVSWEECQKMRADVVYGYEAGARELTIWLDDKRCKSLPDDDRLRCALAGHNAGNAGVASYKTLAYVDWVFAARDRVFQFARYAEQKERSPGT